MKRVVPLISLAFFAALAAASPVFADQGGPMRGARAFGAIRHCLAKVDLSADQKAAIDAVVAGVKSTLQADRQALRADHQKIESDISGGADASVIGQDTLAAHNDGAKFRSDMQSLKDQILAKLSSDQQTTVNGCLDALAPGRAGARSSRS